MITPRRRAVILDLPETIVKDVEQNALSQAAQKHGIDLDSSSKAEARRVIRCSSSLTLKSLTTLNHPELQLN